METNRDQESIIEGSLALYYFIKLLSAGVEEEKDVLEAIYGAEFEILGAAEWRCQSSGDLRGQIQTDSIGPTIEQAVTSSLHVFFPQV